MHCTVLVEWWYRVYIDVVRGDRVYWGAWWYRVYRCSGGTGCLAGVAG